jgi:hypothetical protein
MTMKMIVFLMIEIAIAFCFFGCAHTGRGLTHEYYQTYPTQEADRD